MTIEQIRKARIEAEAEILAILEGLREKTNLCPVGMDVAVVRFGRIDTPYEEKRPTSVRIKFESV